MRATTMALVAAGLVLATAADAQDKKYGPGVTDTRDHHRPERAVQRAGVGLRHLQPRRAGLFQCRQREGRHQQAQDQVHHARQRVQPAQGARSLAQAGRGGQRAGRGRHRRHADQLGDPALSQRQEGAAAPDLGGRQQVQRSQAVSLDGAVLSLVRDRGDRLRPLCAEGAEDAQDRRALPERRLRQGLPQGPEEGAGRQLLEAGRVGAELRAHRSHRRFADHQPRRFGRQRVHELHHAEILRPGAAQGRRAQVEAHAVHRQPRQLGAGGAEGRGLRQGRRRDDGAVLQGAGRSGLGEGPGHAGLLRLHEEVRAQRIRRSMPSACRATSTPRWRNTS